MTIVRKSVLRSVRLDDDVWEAVKGMECSLNQYLRALLLNYPAAAREPLKPVGSVGILPSALEGSLLDAVERSQIDCSGTEQTPTTNAASLDAAGPALDGGRGKASIETWRAKRKPILKPKEGGN